MALLGHASTVLSRDFCTGWLGLIERAASVRRSIDEEVRSPGEPGVDWSVRQRRGQPSSYDQLGADPGIDSTPVSSSPVGEGSQLVLALDDAQVRVPWGGVSPRGLTAAYVRFTLKAQAAKARASFSDPEQFDLWLSGPKGPFVYEGAPCLLPLRGG